MRLEKCKEQLKSEEIIETATNNGSLYYYFKSKSDLLLQCHKHTLLEGMQDFESALIVEKI